jgi:cysteine desulfurase
MKRIYLDYASLTPVDHRVIREVKKYSSAKYANPSSLYKEGVAARKALEEGRKKVADFLHAHGDEIVFAGGGTEVNNLAIEGVLKAAHKIGLQKPHLIISSIEHSSVIEVANVAERIGCEVTRLAVDSRGVVSLDELKKAIKPNTVLVSIMMVNNEVGTVQPIYEALKIVRHARRTNANAEKVDSKYPLFHTDAAQALYEDINMESLGVDLLTLDSSKVYGPRGIGCLYIRRDTPIEPVVFGGGQERGMRSGTENVSAIMGFAKALEIVGTTRVSEEDRIAQLSRFFIEKLRSIRSDVIVNGKEGSRIRSRRPSEDAKASENEVPAQQSRTPFAENECGFTPHILNVSIPGIGNEFFVLQLDAKGIACSTKSSCLRDEEESYVLKAMGANSKTSIRFSFGRYTQKRDIVKAAKIIASILHPR